MPNTKTVAAWSESSRRQSCVLICFAHDKNKTCYCQEYHLISDKTTLKQNKFKKSVKKYLEEWLRLQWNSKSFLFSYLLKVHCWLMHVGVQISLLIYIYGVCLEISWSACFIIFYISFSIILPASFPVTLVQNKVGRMANETNNNPNQYHPCGTRTWIKRVTQPHRCECLSEIGVWACMFPPLTVPQHILHPVAGHQIVLCHVHRFYDTTWEVQTS